MKEIVETACPQLEGYSPMKKGSSWEVDGGWVEEKDLVLVIAI